MIQKHTRTPMLTAALFTTARTRKQPMPTDRGVDKEDMAHIHNRILLSHKKGRK